MSDACQSPLCQQSTSTPFPTADMQLTGATVNLTFGDSSTGTFASGPIVTDEVTLAGLSMQDQPFAAVSNTNNNAVLNGGAGIIGLGFPSQRFVVARVLYVSHLPTPPFCPRQQCTGTSGPREGSSALIAYVGDTNGFVVWSRSHC